MGRAQSGVDPRKPDNIDVEVGRLVRVQRIARGEMVAVDDNFGIRIVEIVDRK